MTPWKTPRRTPSEDTLEDTPRRTSRRTPLECTPRWYLEVSCVLQGILEECPPRCPPKGHSRCPPGCPPKLSSEGILQSVLRWCPPGRAPSLYYLFIENFIHSDYRIPLSVPILTTLTKQNWFVVFLLRRHNVWIVVVSNLYSIWSTVFSGSKN
jgi:hypothetical protein